MARSMRQMKGWQYTLEEDESKVSEESPRKSTRTSRGQRRREDPRIVLRRELDSLELRQADTIFAVDDSQEGETVPSIGIIKDIVFGTDSFLEIRVFWFYRKSEISDQSTESLDNEVYLSPLIDKVELSDILNKCQVISAKKRSEIVLDESNTDDTFVCQRFCGIDGQYVTEPIDWDEMYGQLRENSDDFYQLVKNLTVEPTVGRFTKKLEQKGIDPRSVESQEKKLELKKQRRKKKPSYNEGETDEKEDEFYVYDDQDEDSDEPMDSDEDFRRTKRKYHKRRKRGTATPSTVGPQLPKVARQIVDEDSRELDIDAIWHDSDEETATSEAFRKAKKVLHTSAKLKTLPCREKEFSELFYSLEGAVQSKTGRCLYVSGTPGVGKTATIREVIKQLSASFIAEVGHKMFNYVEINGLKVISPQATYEVLWEKVSGKKATASNALTALEAHFNEDDDHRKPLVVLLDELDQVVTRNQSVMYNFFNWPSYPTSKLIVIAVANTMDLPERLLSNKISSRLGLTRIQFSSYTYPQLSEIIRTRLAKLGRIYEDRMVISNDAIEFASRKVASVSGDARRALMICIRAIEIAELEFSTKTEEEKAKLDGRYTVTIMHIMKAVNETASSPLSNYLGSLPFMGKMLLAAIMLGMKRKGVADVSLGEVYDELNNQFHMVLFGDLKERLTDEQIVLVDAIYGPDKAEIRPLGIPYVMKDLEENGVVIVQQVKLEREKLLRLNISEDEILSALKKDTLVKEIVTEV